MDPGRDGWRIFEGGIGSTLPMACCEDDDDDEEEFSILFFFSETNFCLFYGEPS